MIAVAAAKKTLKTAEETVPDTPQATGKNVASEALSGPDFPSTTKSAPIVDDGDDAPPRHKNFGLALRVADMEPLSFELCERTFQCIPAMTSRRLLNFVRKADGADGAKAGDAIYSFMEAAILPEQREEWNALLNDEEYVIDVGLIGDVVSWLVEQYSGRPTLRSSLS